MIHIFYLNENTAEDAIRKRQRTGKRMETENIQHCREELLYRLVDFGSISVNQAAAQAFMSATEFQEKMNAYLTSTR